MKKLTKDLTLTKTTVQLLDDQSLIDVRGGVKIILGSNSCKTAGEAIKLEAKSCCRRSC